MTERIVVDGGSIKPQRIVVEGDSVTMPLRVGTGVPAEVTVQGGIVLSGTGHATIDEKKVCLADDVKHKRYQYTYSKAPFTEDGNGTLQIEAVAADHIHSADTGMISDGKVMISDGKIKLSFTRGTPANIPEPYSEDTDPPSGSYEFDLKMFNAFVSSKEE